MSALQGLLTKDKQASMLSSLSTFFGSSHCLPSLIETEHCGEFPWFAYIVLEVETSYELDESHFWTDLQQYLLEHTDCSIDAAIQVNITVNGYYSSKYSLQLDQSAAIYVML